MAFKRAHRAGQIIRLPLICDPEYRERRAARIAAGASDADIASEERLFHATLDASTLKTDLTDVTHVTIRGLSGDAFADADMAASIASAKSSNDERVARYTGATVMAVVRAGLVDSGLDGLPVTDVAPYPVHLISGPGGLGAEWPAYSVEVFGLIHAWSHLGESAGSSSAPSRDGLT